jgi:hypothetical protein
MAAWEAWHWRIVFTSWATTLLLRPEATIELEGVPSAAPGPKLLILLVGMVVLAIGLAILRAQPYRPDLGDSSYLADPFGARAQRALPQRRSWWTGDRQGSSSRADA